MPKTPLDQLLSALRVAECPTIMIATLLTSLPAVQMNRFKIQNAILLSYLVLFLNFGPSFHRASVFGLHDHQEAAATQSLSQCSCGHHHEQPEPGSSSEQSIEQQPCDCSLCSYFKQFHAAGTHYQLPTNEHLLIERIEYCQSKATRIAIACRARGPPLA